MKVVKLLDEKEASNRLDNTVSDRFLSIDPLTRAYPELTPYQFAENTPIQAIDLDGLEKYVVTNYYNNEGVLRKVTIKSIRSQDTRKVVDLNMQTANGGDLTNRDVYVRNLFANGRQQAPPVERGNLTKDEQKLYNAAKASRENSAEFDKIFYEFSDQQKGTGIKSEEFASNNFEYNEATKNIPLIKNLNVKFKDGTFAYLGTTNMVGGNTRNGTLNLDYPGGENVKRLLKDVKEDGGIKSVQITLSANVSNVDETGFAAFKRGLEYAAQQYGDLFRKAGVKNVQVTTIPLRDQPQTGAGGIDVQLRR